GGHRRQNDPLFLRWGQGFLAGSCWLHKAAPFLCSWGRGSHTLGKGSFAPPERGVSRGLRAPVPRGLDPVGVTHPHTPGFTFGRPKVNRKTAKTNGFGFLCPIGL